MRLPAIRLENNMLAGLLVPSPSSLISISIDFPISVSLITQKVSTHSPLSLTISGEGEVVVVYCNHREETGKCCSAGETRRRRPSGMH